MSLKVTSISILKQNCETVLETMHTSDIVGRQQNGTHMIIKSSCMKKDLK